MIRVEVTGIVQQFGNGVAPLAPGGRGMEESRVFVPLEGEFDGKSLPPIGELFMVDAVGEPDQDAVTIALNPRCVSQKRSKRKQWLFGSLVDILARSGT